jgi:Zn-dependent alcohol dehydrogenase
LVSPGALDLVSRTCRMEKINTAFATLENGEVARSIICYG